MRVGSDSTAAEAREFGQNPPALYAGTTIDRSRGLIVGYRRIGLAHGRHCIRARRARRRGIAPGLRRRSGRALIPLAKPSSEGV
jgi:hypothetical protein